MPATLLDRILHLPPAWRRRAAQHCETIWLLGAGRYTIEVAGSRHEQDHLQSLLADHPAEHASRVLVASIRPGWNEERQREMVYVAAGGGTLGYCPSHLSTRLTEWLRQWQLEEAEVWCSVRLYRGRLCGEKAGPIMAYLDIDQPFRMKTVS